MEEHLSIFRFCYDVLLLILRYFYKRIGGEATAEKKKKKKEAVKTLLGLRSCLLLPLTTSSLAFPVVGDLLTGVSRRSQKNGHSTLKTLSRRKINKTQKNSLL